MPHSMAFHIMNDYHLSLVPLIVKNIY